MSPLREKEGWQNKYYFSSKIRDKLLMLRCFEQCIITIIFLFFFPPHVREKQFGDVCTSAVLVC